MGLADFRRGAAQPAASGSRFGGGGAAKPAAGGRFGGGRQAAPDPVPEDEGQPDGYGDEPEEPAQPAQGSRFGRSPAAAPAGRFGGGGRAAGAGGRGPGREPGGRFTGLRSEVEQPPFLEEGEHHVEVLLTFEKQSEKNGGGDVYCHIHLKVIESSTVKAGEPRNLLCATSGKGRNKGLERLMAFVRGVCGFEDDESFKAAIPNYNVLIGAVCGERECEESAGPDGKPFGENPLQGMRVYCNARKGNSKTNQDGSVTQYYNYVWSPAEES